MNDFTFWAQELHQYGIYVVASGWGADEQTLVRRAVSRLGDALGGPEGLRRALGGIILAKRKEGGGGTYVFWPRFPWKRVVIGEPLFHQAPVWLGEVAVVHELAHIWDAHTADIVRRILGRPGRIVRELVRFVGEEPGPTWYGSRASGLKHWQAASEEWAESVAAYLYPEYIAHLSNRPEERQWPLLFGLAEHIRPGLGDRHRAYVEARFEEIRRAVNTTG